jgi:hypothetical protein
MGREATCTVRVGRKTATGKALLETSELIFRGDGLRLAIPFAEIRAVAVREGTLSVRGPDGEVRLELGAEAAAWAGKIKRPPSRLDKLGVKPGMKVSLVGGVEPAFIEELRARTEDVSHGRPRSGSDLLIYAVEAPADLERLAALKKSLQPAGALWVVRTKGPAAKVTESAVMAAGKAAGLVDTKVVAFSATHTAERLVIPVAQRSVPTRR